MARKRGNGQGSLYKRKSDGCWIASWYDHDRKRHEESTGTTSRATAERILRKKIDDALLRREGIIDAKADRFASENRKPLADHIADYIEHCRHVGQAVRHVDQKYTHLKALRQAAGATRLSDLTADALERHLRTIKAAGKSARTVNFARQIAVAFVSWCVDTARVESNPLAIVPKLDESRDRRRVRRPMTDDELARLLDIAGNRRLWYMAAALAGLRKGDMQRLKWKDIDLDAGTVTISHGKAKRTDMLPLHPQLAEALRQEREAARALPAAKVFPTTPTDATRLRDFLKAGIARREVITDAEGKPVMIGKCRHQRPKTRIVAEDEEGRAIDLHALRTTLGTSLARAGVAPQLAQRIMRHSDYRTTLKHYTGLGLTDPAQAIAKLPPIEADKPAAAIHATGTTGQAQAAGNAGNGARNAHGNRHAIAGHSHAAVRSESAPIHERAIEENASNSAGIRGSTQSGEAVDMKAGDENRTRNIQLGRLTLYR